MINKYIVALAGVISITVICTACVIKGIDGTLIASCAGIIGTVVGYCFGQVNKGRK